MEPFVDYVDYYDVLQVSPTAQPETIARVYKLLAARYHPDNPETGDLERFLKLKHAYEVLSDPQQRAEFDHLHEGRRATPIEVFGKKEFSDVEGEANRRMGVLCLLYNRRRLAPDKAGSSVLDLEAETGVPREHLAFTLWYLRQKALIEINQDGDNQITAAGCDQVESNLPGHKLLQKLIKGPERAPDPDRPDH
jgi:curved DNA-binding protein CbpA